MSTLVTGIGVCVESVGIVLAGVGLYFTWKDNAPPERQVSRVVRQFMTAAKRRLRRRKSVTVSVGTTWAVASVASGVGVVTPGLQSMNPEMSRAELIAASSRNFEAIQQTAIQAHGAVGEVRHQHDQASKQLRQELVARDDKLLAEVKSLAVDGIPIAVGGLALTFIGLVVQAIGTFV